MHAVEEGCMTIFMIYHTGFLEVAMLSCFAHFLQYMSKGKYQNKNSYTLVFIYRTLFYMPHTLN